METLIINRDTYRVTVITPGKRFKLEKKKGNGWEESYYQELLADCTCESRIRPCKHVKAVTAWSNEKERTERLEEARKDAEAAIDKAEIEGTEEAMADAQRAYRTWDLLERFR